MIDPEIEREFANQRRAFDLELSALKQLSEQRIAATSEALRIALLSNETRLNGMNEFRSALTDQSARMLTRVEADASARLITERIEQNRTTFEARFSDIIKPKWTLMLSLASIFLVVVGGVWALVGLKVDATVTPVTLEAAALKSQMTSTVDRLAANDQLTAAATSANGQSRSDRQQLNDRVRSVEVLATGSSQADAGSRSDRQQLNDRVRLMESGFASGQAERRAQYAVLSAKLVEIETQFCASDIVRSLIHASDMRIQSLLWSRSYPGEHMPTDNAFYAHICNRQPTND
jgi:3-phenylpropionate/cinnamic acid dioxygenase small subunit